LKDGVFQEEDGKLVKGKDLVAAVQIRQKGGAQSQARGNAEEQHR